jgi:acyl dehydratase
MVPGLFFGAGEVRMPQRVIDGVVELEGLVGQEVGVSDWFTLTQERINAFAEVTVPERVCQAETFFSWVGT